LFWRAVVSGFRREGSGEIWAAPDSSLAEAALDQAGQGGQACRAGEGQIVQVTFRASQAADAAASAPLAHSSGPESFDYVFANGRATGTDFLRYALAREGGEFGYGVHIVGEQGGRIVASGGGWVGGHGAFALATMASVIGFAPVLALPGINRRGSQAVSVMPDPAKDEYYIGHLGVDPALRGQGIGEAMVGYLLKAAAASRATRAVLDVSVENPRAQALYERLGFVVTATRASSFANAFGRIPGHRRMQRVVR
jgi:ribosomal protein S18 acetylase RimI-like enzyme